MMLCPPVSRLRALFTITAAALLAGAPVLAQQEPASQERLNATEDELDRTLTEAQALQSAARQLDQDIANLRRTAAETVGKVRAQEEKLLQLDRDIAALEVRERSLSASLQEKDQDLVRLLLPLQRMAVQPPEALLFQPVPLSDTVKSAIMLRRASAPLAEDAQALARDLQDLYALRAQIQLDKEETKTVQAALQTDEQELQTLLEDLRNRRQDIGAEALAAQDRALALADQVEDLRGLLEALETAAVAPKPEPPPERVVPDAPDADVVLARRPPPPAPTRVPFTELRGQLPYPVVGTLVDRYGEETALGSLSKGIRLRARPATPVIAPHDGRVVFSGPFRGYGRILLIEYSEGYHTLLAGLGRLDAVTGQDVLAGEPVGIMDNTDQASLYVEVRRDGRPINPQPWLTAQKGTPRG